MSEHGIYLANNVHAGRHSAESPGQRCSGAALGSVSPINEYGTDCQCEELPGLADRLMTVFREFLLNRGQLSVCGIQLQLQIKILQV